MTSDETHLRLEVIAKEIASIEQDMVDQMEIIDDARKELGYLMEVLLDARGSLLTVIKNMEVPE